MKVYREFVAHSITEKPVVFTLGTFDGVHVGHQKLLGVMHARAKELQLQTVVLSFSNHPFVQLGKELPVPLTTEEEKLKRFEACGVDIVIVLQFTEEIRLLTASQFVEKLFSMFSISVWVAGEDIGFGLDRKGDFSFLKEESLKRHMELIQVPKFMHDGQPVSSSRIRALLASENRKKAEELLSIKTRIAT